MRFSAPSTASTNHNNNNEYVQSVIDNAGFDSRRAVCGMAAARTSASRVGSNTPDGQGNATFYLGVSRTETSHAEHARLLGLRPQSRRRREFGIRLRRLAATTSGASSPCSAGPTTARPTTTSRMARSTWVPYDSSFLYNYAPTNYIQRADNRVSAGAFAHYDYNDTLSVYGGLMFMDDHTFSQAAPERVFPGQRLPDQLRQSVVVHAAGGSAVRRQRRHRHQRQHLRRLSIRPAGPAAP